MPAKLKLLLLLAFVSPTAFAQQTSACDSVYIKVAGMVSTQSNINWVSLKKDAVLQLKRLYVSNPAYTISSFVFGHTSMCGGGISNNGPAFDSRILSYIQNAKSGTKFYFDDIIISSSSTTCRKAFIIEVK